MGWTLPTWHLACRGDPGDRHVGAHRRALPRRAVDVQAAPEGLDAILEPAQAGSVVDVGAADAGVGDLDQQAVPERPDLDAGDRRLGVLGDVRERLGDHVVGGDLDRVGRALGGVEGELDGDRRPLRQGLDRRLEAVIGEHGRVQAARQLPQLGERRRELLRRPGHRRMRGRGALVDQAVGDAQADRERDEPLLGAVVEVALQAPALGVARDDNARA